MTAHKDRPHHSSCDAIDYEGCLRWPRVPCSCSGARHWEIRRLGDSEGIQGIATFFAAMGASPVTPAGAPQKTLRFAGYFHCRPDGSVGQWCPDSPLPLPNGWTRHAALIGSAWDSCSLEPYGVGESAVTPAAQTVAVPDEVMRALYRMCTPLDDSWLGSKSATAQEDARCMNIIREYIMSVGRSLATIHDSHQPAAPDAAVKDSLTTGDSCQEDIDLWDEDDEPEHVCTCNVMHDDLEHAENLCSACGLMIEDPWGPVYVAGAQQQKEGGE